METSNSSHLHRLRAQWKRSVMRGFTGAIALLLVAVAIDRWVNRPPAAVEDSLALSAFLEDDGFPREITPQVERWIRHYLTTDPRGFQSLLTREGLYGGIIRQKLRSREMPEPLLYIAMIESGFSVAATSHAAAGGMWQFLGATARHYGLSVDGWVDERRDPVRATDAALDYLEELYAEFGSWYLAMAAYNASPARVSEGLARAGVALPLKSEAEFWRVARFLPSETQAYVPKIVAVSLLAEHPEHFGLEVTPVLPYLFDQVLVPAGTPLARVASALELPPSLLRELNPHLIRGMTPPGRSFPVRIPQGAGQQVLAALSPR
jgi:membrane-bound lytic murein transglycosylase D